MRVYHDVYLVFEVFFFFNYLTYSFFMLVVLGLYRCMRAFSSCREQGLLLVTLCRLLIAWLLLLQSTGYRCTGFSTCRLPVLAQQTRHTGLAAPQYAEYFQTRYSTHIPHPHQQVDSYPLYHQGSSSFFEVLSTYN